MTPSPALPFPSNAKTSTEPSLLPCSRRLHIGRSELAAAISAAGPETSLLGIIAVHAYTTLRLAAAGVRYLQSGPAAGDAYRRMTTAEFSRINARQTWANWRTIPRNLSGNLPTDRPLTVLDLCCGTGESTRVLAWWLPCGSKIIGYEQDHRFAAAASARTYRNRIGEMVPVTVQCASVLEGFHDQNRQRFRAGDVDLVHAIGSLGCHFRPRDCERILHETARVLMPGGLALLDAGKSGTPPKTLAHLAAEAGLTVIGSSRSWWLDRYVQLVLRKGPGKPDASEYPGNASSLLQKLTKETKILDSGEVSQG